MKTNLITISSLIAGLFLTLVAQAQSSLEGAWEIEEVTVAGGSAAGTNMRPQPGVFIFTANHYSIVLVPGNEPRPLFTDQTSDQQRLAAYDRFIANTGTYETNGATIQIRPMVAKNPAAMAGEGFSAEYSVQGNSMTFVISEAWAQQGSRITYRLRRLLPEVPQPPIPGVPQPPTFIVP